MKISFELLLAFFRFRAFAAYLNRSGVAARLGITSTQLTSTNTAKTNSDTACDAYVSPDTHNTGTVNDMIVATNAATAISDGLIAQMLATPGLVLTGMDKMMMSIPEQHHRRGLIPTPTATPVLVVIDNSPLIFTMIVFEPSNPFKRAKPKDVDSIGLKMAVMPVGTPPRPEDYRTLTPARKTQFEINFTSDQIGKVAYIIANYQNYRGEAGPDSAPCSATITGI